MKALLCHIVLSHSMHTVEDENKMHNSHYSSIVVKVE